MFLLLLLRRLLVVLPTLLLLGLVVPASLRAQGLVPDSTELRVLRQFYYATGGPTWNRNGNWLTGTTLADAATWEGVQTDGQDIIGLALSSNNLQGNLPATLGLLRGLRSIGLWQNQLSGTLPNSLGQLRLLQYLWLHNNRFTGELPTPLGRLTHLLSLGVSDNQLSGPLPDSLARCAALQTLVLSNNQFSGPLPTGWSALSKLGQLMLASNQLSGSFPASWTALPKLYLLYLEHNQLSGTLPGLPPGAQQINLAYNRFEGPLPANLGSSSNLFFLALSHNRFTGTLPSDLGQLAHLGYLSLEDNLFTGSIPTAWGQLTGLRQLDLSRNYLSGTIPAGILRLPSCTVWLASNQLTQVETTPEATLPVQLHLSDNYLDFGALEALATGPGQLKPVFLDARFQRTRTPADTQYVVQGTQPWVARRVGGTHNHYTWQRRIGEQLWVPLTGGDLVNSPSTVPDVDIIQLINMRESMEGEYRVQVTNDWFPGTILTSRSRYLSMIPYELARNEPNSGGCSVVTGIAPTDRTGQQDSVNYVRTYTARTALTDPSLLRGAAVQDVQVKTQYLDGLGRPVQAVQHQASPSGQDVVQPLAYDAMGRQPKQYLPYTVAPTAGASGAYRPNALLEQFNFYHSPTAAGIPATGVAYAETAFEASPLNRVLAQASPGETWQLNAANNHAVHTTERPNHPEQDTVRRWLPGYGTERENLQPNGVYASGTLWVTQITDEQGQVSRSYTDPQGRVVLKQVSLGKVNNYTVGSGDGIRYYERRNWLSTYYIYDDFGRLRAVIPPLAEQRLRAHNWAVDGAGLEHLLFRYHYDDRGRLVEKTVPDQDGYTDIIYDQLDRPVLTQDIAQRARAEWTATKYDTLGRVVLTALVRRPGQTRAQLQAVATAALTRCERPATAVGPGEVYYTNRAWPVLTAADVVLSTTDYDGYDFDHNGADDAHYLTQYDTELGLTGYQGAPDPRATGQPTRTRTRVLGVAATAPGAWLTATSFFDDQLRPIQVQSTNARGGQDVVTTRFDFSGKPLVTMTVHQGPNHMPIPLREIFVYDPTDRLLETRQELEGRAPVVIAANSYNELGQLQQKHLGGDNAQAALQTVDYAYNIRGWLTRVNDAQLTPKPGQRPDLFGLELSYDCGFYTNQYNGNIAGQKWRTASDNVERAYGYRYDQLSRLQQGDFVARDATGTWNAERDNYRFWAASYDANGNLLTMRRRGLVQEATRTTPRRYGEIDNLRYRFQPAASSPDAASNRLLRVDDLAPAASTFGSQQPTRPDFQDGATTGSPQPDYAYDAAGSLISDRNKEIDTISYNHLHLPIRIVWANGNRLEFRYTAAGQKVAKLATPAGKPTVRTDYLGAWQYEGDSLRWLNTSEGRTLRFVQRDAAGQPITRYSYEYTIKDHLGNLRVAFRPGDKAKHRATMEPALADQEEAQFDYVRETRYATTDAAAGQYVARLNAAAGKPLGPLKTLTVRKGDTLQIEAFGRYQQPAQNTSYIFSMLGFVTSLLQQPAAPQAGEPHTTRPRALPFLGIGLAVVPQLVQLSNGVPKSYLRALVFTKDSVLITSYTQQLTMAAQNGYQRLHLNLTAPQDGFVQAYVGNESDVDVYFDDISIEYQPTLLVQENQYDPFGLDLVGVLRITEAENKFGFGGKENQEEFDLNWRDYGARLYGSELGIWKVIDPKSEQFVSQSPYVSFDNNPTNIIDPDGKAARSPDDHYINKDGSINTVATNDKTDSFYVQSGLDNTYTKVAALEKNDAGLVNFPANGDGFNRYGGEDSGGNSTKPTESVGSGDHYVEPLTAAALFGVINELKNQCVTLSLGDMSSSNGSDPWQAGGQHHGGHGHLGNRSGADVDFRYVDASGYSFQSRTATSDKQYSVANNAAIYRAANRFGFTKNYQGTNGAIPGVTKVGGHNDHGHLGLTPSKVDWHYVKTAPTKTIGLFH